MKKLTATVIALSAAVIATSAQAQQAPVTGSQNQPRKLFFEGDIVRHALPGQQGPFCVLANQFKRKEAIAWRIRILHPNGDIGNNETLKSVEAQIVEKCDAIDGVKDGLLDDPRQCKVDVATLTGLSGGSAWPPPRRPWLRRGRALCS